MVKASKRTEQALSAPVDGEDDDRRESAQQDEHRGLAARLLDLRRTVEAHEKQRVADLAETRRLVAEIGQRADTMQRQLDEALASIGQKQRDLEVALRDGAEQVRAAGELGRKMSDHVKVLDELREMAADPHEVIKPLRKDIGELKQELLLLNQQVDHRFEETGKRLDKVTARDRAYETRN